MMNYPSWVRQSCLNLNLSRLIVLAITKVNILTKSKVFVDVLITVFHDVDFDRMHLFFLPDCS